MKGKFRTLVGLAAAYGSTVLVQQLVVAGWLLLPLLIYAGGRAYDVKPWASLVMGLVFTSIVMYLPAILSRILATSRTLRIVVGLGAVYCRTLLLGQLLLAGCLLLPFLIYGFGRAFGVPLWILVLALLELAALIGIYLHGVPGFIATKSTLTRFFWNWMVPFIWGAAPVVIVLLFTMSAMLLPPVQVAREAARRTACNNNLKQIGLALYNYHAVYDSFPPAAICDSHGSLLLSWRVLLLPFMEQKDLYDDFHLDEPWDSDHNRNLIPRVPPVFRCPYLPMDPSGKTTYLAVTGEGTMFSGCKVTKFEDITDPRSRTPIVVEVNESRAVPWTKPDDFVFSPLEPRSGLDTLHPSGIRALMADGSVLNFRVDGDPEELKRLFDASEGKTGELDLP